MLNQEQDRMNIKILENPIAENIIHRVEKNETIEQIAKLYNQTKEVLLEVNGLKRQIEEGDRLLIPKKNKAIYVVKPLDTIPKIAKKFNVTENQIKKENNTEKIFIGQVLVI